MFVRRTRHDVDHIERVAARWPKIGRLSSARCSTVVPILPDRAGLTSSAADSTVTGGGNVARFERYIEVAGWLIYKRCFGAENKTLETALFDRPLVGRRRTRSKVYEPLSLVSVVRRLLRLFPRWSA